MNNDLQRVLEHIKHLNKLGKLSVRQYKRTAGELGLPAYATLYSWGYTWLDLCELAGCANTYKNDNLVRMAQEAIRELGREAEWKDYEALRSQRPELPSQGYLKRRGYNLSRLKKESGLIDPWEEVDDGERLPMRQPTYKITGNWSTDGLMVLKSYVNHRGEICHILR